MTNIKLTYEYTLSSIKVTSDSIDKLNIKLTVVLTFSGVLINFGKELPGYLTLIQCQSFQYPCLTCYLFQFVAYTFILIAIVTSLRGLSPAEAGKTVLPEQLLTDEWNQADEEQYMTALVEYLEKETLLPLDSLRNEKSKKLYYAISSLGAAVIMLGLDKVLAVSKPILEKLCN